MPALISFYCYYSVQNTNVMTELSYFAQIHQNYT